MIDNAATIANMKEAGLSAETILLALGCIVLCPPAVERSGAARRQAAYRERKKDRHNALPTVDNVTQQQERSPTPPKENTLTGININPPVPLLENQGFDAFWTEYPKRDGNADKKAALKAFGPALKRAGSLDAILTGAKAYAAHCREKGKIGTEYVKQARSWLNGDLWLEWQPKAPPEPFNGASNGRIWVKAGTEAFDAWDAWWRKHKGKSAPRDTKGGWYFDTEYPQEQAA